MRVHDAVHAGILLEYLAVDAAFLVALRNVPLDGGRIFDTVLDDVGRGRYEGGGDGVREVEGARVGGVAEGDVAVGVEDVLVVEDVVGGYEIF